jgi:hypothetical protein
LNPCVIDVDKTSVLVDDNCKDDDYFCSVEVPIISLTLTKDP